MLHPHKGTILVVDIILLPDSCLIIFSQCSYRLCCFTTRVRYELRWQVVFCVLSYVLYSYRKNECIFVQKTQFGRIQIVYVHNTTNRTSRTSTQGMQVHGRLSKDTGLNSPNTVKLAKVREHRSYTPKYASPFSSTYSGGLYRVN